jgi:hypothetical protein
MLFRPGLKARSSSQEHAEYRVLRGESVVGSFMGRGTWSWIVPDRAMGDSEAADPSVAGASAGRRDTGHA